jgi:hypothetical protein
MRGSAKRQCDRALLKTPPPPLQRSQRCERALARHGPASPEYAKLRKAHPFCYALLSGTLGAQVTPASLATARSPCDGRNGSRRRVRSHCRFRNRGTEYVREYGMKRMNGGTKRQCDRALPDAPPGPPQSVLFAKSTAELLALSFAGDGQFGRPTVVIGDTAILHCHRLPLTVIPVRAPHGEARGRPAGGRAAILRSHARAVSIAPSQACSI